MRLEVPASQVGLEGSTLKGMDFSVYGGRVAWDRAGKTSIATSSPVLASSVPSVINRVTGGAIQFKWQRVAGKTYRVAYKNELTDAAWTDLSQGIIATGTTCSWTDITAASASKRFYVVYVVN